MSDFDFRILISKPRSPAPVQLSLADYLEGHAAGEIDWPPAPESASLSLVVAGEERLAGLSTLGSLRMLTRQLEDARARLGRGEMGLVRTADLDVIEPPYFLFEPDDPRDPQAVLVSLLVIEDEEASGWFPLAAWGLVDPETLFAYVRAHRSELIRAGEELGEPDVPLTELAVPFGQLLDAIGRETALAWRVLALHPEEGTFDDV